MSRDASVTRWYGRHHVHDAITKVQSYHPSVIQVLSPLRHIMSAQARLGSYSAVQSGATAWIFRFSTPIRVAARGYRARAMLGLHTPDGAERVSRGLDSCDRAREIVVRLDRAGSGGVVDPGAACWVGISCASGVMAREAQRMSSQ